MKVPAECTEDYFDYLKRTYPDAVIGGTKFAEALLRYQATIGALSHLKKQIEKIKEELPGAEARHAEALKAFIAVGGKP